MKKERIFFTDEIMFKLRENGELWFTLDDISRFYHRDKKTIAFYIKNILIEEAFLVNVTKYVKINKKEVCYYNLDVVLSVGYRVKSDKGIMFRKYANKVIKEKLLSE